MTATHLAPRCARPSSACARTQGATPRPRTGATTRRWAADSLSHVVGSVARRAIEPRLIVVVRRALKSAAMFRVREPGHDAGILHYVAYNVLRFQPHFGHFIGVP